jgi:hypothetical protein
MTTTLNERDEAAANTVRRHHEHLVAELEQLVAALPGTGEHSSAPESPRTQLVSWARTVLAPHAAGEETTFYRAAAETEAGRLLIAGMEAEHGVILGIVDAIEAGTEPAGTLAWSQALLRVFSSHAAKENDLVLPLLVAEPDANLAELLEQMHDEVH